jgi:hypothetical protein
VRSPFLVSSCKKSRYIRFCIHLGFLPSSSCTAFSKRLNRFGWPVKAILCDIRRMIAKRQKLIDSTSPILEFPKKANSLTCKPNSPIHRSYLIKILDIDLSKFKPAGCLFVTINNFCQATLDNLALECQAVLDGE